MHTFILVLIITPFAVEAAVIPTTTEPPDTTEPDTTDIIFPPQPHVCIFLCIRGFHCGPVPCNDPNDSGCIGCVPDEPPPCATTTTAPDGY